MRMPDRDLAVRLLPDRITAAQYRPDIEGLRGLAVALVVAYHAFPNLRSGGFIGVDVFFVISGYLITQLILSGLQRGTFSLSEFYRRRVRRIVPALLVVMTACFIVGWLMLLPSELRWLGKSIAWCAPFLANLYLARTAGGYFDPVAELNPLLHLWSLGVEEQFYLVWPVLLILTVKHGVAMRFLAAVIATSLAFSIWSAWNGTPHFYHPATRAWELAVGGMLAAWTLSAVHRPPSLRWSGTQALALAGLAMVIVGGVCWTADKRIPGIWSVIPTVGAALLIGAGPNAAVNRWLLASPPMRFLGRLSYPLYLWHWPLFSFTHVVLGTGPQPAMAAGAIVLAFAAAYATYRWVELPTRYGDLGRRAVPALLAGLVLLALAGAAVEARWISGRLSGPIFTQWDAAANDWHFSGDYQVDRRSGFGILAIASRRDRKALFIGDSHIQQYWPRVRHLIDAQPHSARSALFVTYAGWPPLPSINYMYPRTNTGGRFEHAMEQAFRPDVDTVVFGAFWEYYFLGEYSADHSVSQLNGASASARAPLQLDSPGTQIAFENFERAISKLVLSGRRVYIVLSNPTSPLFVPVFPPDIRLSLQSPGSLPRDSAPGIDAGPFEMFVAPLTDRLRSIAAQTGAKAVDPRSTLCDGMICPSADSDGLPLYLDSNHLNGSNSRERATFVDEMLLGPDAQLNDTERP
jgi:peptidoglycan/LPS O-acetylase OafA/YrhL